MLRNYIDRIPIGYSEGVSRGRRYGITKSAFNVNRSFKVYAEQLGGNDFVSLNYYVKRAEDALRPCQMAADKVIDFLKNVELQ